ncbi:MAG: GntR family transcriptional regulator [Armatimonadetes bacterium]|nr:GntR family transcriptional regulator [Armatimonadota bacterium]
MKRTTESTDGRPRKATRVDELYEAILDRLITGRLRPGDHLVEPQLAQELQCSRTPLRSALTRLVSEGLLEQRSHCGRFVAHPTPEELRQVFEVRAAIEPLAARLMATHASGADLRALAVICQGLVEARESLDMAAYNRLDFSFHRRIVQACGNRYLAAVGHAGALVLLSFMIPDYFQPLNEDLPWPAPEPEDGHVSVYQAILTGDGDAAEARMREHIQASSEVMQAYLQGVLHREGGEVPQTGRRVASA